MCLCEGYNSHSHEKKRGRPKKPETVFSDIVFKEIDLSTGNKLYWSCSSNPATLEMKRFVFTAKNDEEAEDMAFSFTPRGNWKFDLVSRMKTNNNGRPQFKVVRG